MLRKLTRYAMGILVSGTMLASSVEAAFNAQLQGQSFGSTNWIASNLTGWRELDLIPMRVYMTGGPASNRVITVQFDHIRSSGKLMDSRRAEPQPVRGLVERCHHLRAGPDRHRRRRVGVLVHRHGDQ